MVDHFKGVKLTPTVARQSLPDVLTRMPQDGSSFLRRDFIKEMRYVAQNLGIVIDESTLIHQVKRVLAYAVENKLLNRPFEGAMSYGISHSGQHSADLIDDNAPPLQSNPNINGEENKVSSNSNQIDTEQIVGIGSQCVYCYYFPTYKRLAEVEKKLHYPIKIGFSKDSNPEGRVLSQASTALPENPVIALLIKTDDAAGLEKVIHSSLSFKGKRLNEARGEEWFLTNTEEIANVVNIILETNI